MHFFWSDFKASHLAGSVTSLQCSLEAMVNLVFSARSAGFVPLSAGGDGADRHVLYP